MFPCTDSVDCDLSEQINFFFSSVDGTWFNSCPGWDVWKQEIQQGMTNE